MWSCGFDVLFFSCSYQAGADPNLPNLPNLCCPGESPLGIAAAEGATEVIKCLLKAGANPNVTNIVSVIYIYMLLFGTLLIITVLIF